MPEKKTVHIWMLDGRSLCDRRALPARRADEPEEEREAARQESAAAPACGACLLLAGRVRREAATILERHPQVHPAKPSAAWDSLRGTRWSAYFDLDALEDQAIAVDESSSYDAMRSALHPDLVSDLSAEWDRMIASGRAIDDDEIGFKGPTEALS